MTDRRIGLVLAGGKGSRLGAATRVVSKQLLPVYDKPLIYYPLTSLLLAGIREFIFVCAPGHVDSYRKLLGTGEDFDSIFHFVVQEEPRGLADGILTARHILDNSDFTMMLGDNIFFGSGFGRRMLSGINPSGATVYAYEHRIPGDFGVIQFDSGGGVISIEEKPKVPKSKFVMPGLYHFDKTAVERAESLRPSERGELEIVDLVKLYLSTGDLKVQVISQGVSWFDTGTAEGLYEASSFVRAIQLSQGRSVGDPFLPMIST